MISVTKISLEKCDETCYTCADTNVKCTSCKAPLFWIDSDGGQCVRSCPDLPGFSNYFGDIEDRVCKPCRPNCNMCTGWNGCTDCSNYNTTETVMQQNGSFS